MPIADYLWHPILVHFSVALLSVATVLYVLSALLRRARPRAQWLTVAEWNLWVGVALTVVTMLLGWLAFNTVQHDDAAHAVMTTHAQLAIATGIGFAVLAAWSVWQRRSTRYPSWPYTALAVVCLGLLLATGLRGGELVYQHGLAVASSPPKSDTDASAPVKPHIHRDGKPHVH